MMPDQDQRGFAATLVVCGLSALFAVTAPAQEAPSPATTEEPRVLAMVNGETLSVPDLERHLGTLHGSANEGPRGAPDLDRLIFRMVNDVLIGQEARALGMDQEGGIPERVTRYREKLTLEALEREEIAERARPTEDEVRRTFEDQYRELTLRVVTAYEQPEAEELLAVLRAGADMEALARERSVDPYAIRGGHLDSVPRIDLQPEIAELAASLTPGELAGPVRTDLGWSTIRLEEVRAADPERLPKVARTIAQVVRHRKSQALRAALAESARARHEVVVDEGVAGALSAERRPDARLFPIFPDPDAVVARIGTRHVITANEYSKALLARWNGVRNREAALASAPIILEKMIEKRLLQAEAEARAYVERPEIVRAVHTFETGLLVPRYLEEVVAPGVEVEREEMEAYYAAHQDELRKPPRINLGQVTVATEEEAERIASLLREDTDLAWLARRHSLDRFKDQGGERGWVEPGFSGFEQRLLEATAGQVLDPVGVRGNFVVFKVIARQEQGVYPFQEVSGNVRNAVFEDRMKAAIEKLMETLRSRSEIEIDQELLASLQIRGTLEDGPDKGKVDGHGH